MFLSLLHVNVSNGPGRLWLRNLYRVHQRLCMAFPSRARKDDDKEFLRPFVPSDFGDGQVHVTRGAEHGFMFRIDPLAGGGIVILVQSAVKPDWEYAFHNAGHFLAARPEVKEFSPSFAEGQQLRFRLVANPTRKIDTKSGPDGKQRNGKRVPVPDEKLYEWLVRKGEMGGFQVSKDTVVQPGYVYVDDSEKLDGKRLRSVRYDGLLSVNNPARFGETLASGIGSAKGFGFGLLSIATVK